MTKTKGMYYHLALGSLSQLRQEDIDDVEAHALGEQLIMTKGPSRHRNQKVPHINFLQTLISTTAKKKTLRKINQVPPPSSFDTFARCY